MTFKDVAIIKKILGEKLLNYQGTVSSKQELDAAYLAVVDFLNGAATSCASSGLSFSEIENLDVALSFNLEPAIRRKLEKDNLTLDF